MCRLPEGRTALHAERYDAWREEEGPKQGVKRTTRNQGVERVVRFKALDGTEHETHAAARRHNTDMALTRWLESWVTAHPWRANELAENVEQLAAALRKDWIISQRKEQGK
jgi:hypothetical protein